MHEKKHRIPTHVLYKIFIYVALIALAISIIVPVAWVFMASLKKNAEFIGADVNPWALPKQFYYQNFVVAFQDARMGDFFLNSFIVTALALALLLILALPASYVLARFKFRGKKFFNGAFMAGLFINVNYIVVPIFLMLSSWNKALHVDFFLDNRFILALIYASCNLPFTIYLLSGYFQTLPKGFEEAAYMDGCGYFKTMVKIMIPMGCSGSMARVRKLLSTTSTGLPSSCRAAASRSFRPPERQACSRRCRRRWSRRSGSSRR